jgi:hypothetical protein
MAKGGKWIQGAIKNPGALTKKLGKSKKTGTIPVSKLQKAAKGKGVTAKRARLALTLRKMGKKKGS